MTSSSTWSCQEFAPDQVEHKLMALLSNLTKGSLARLTTEAMAADLDTCQGEVRDGLATLRDLGAISNSENGLLRIDGHCPHKEILNHCSPKQSEGSAREYSVLGRDVTPQQLSIGASGSRELVAISDTEAPGPNPDGGISPKLTTVYLAKFYFPKAVREACRKRGVRALNQQNWQALAKSFGEWRRDEGVSLEEIKEMIDQFCRYPEWWKGKLAWRVFLGRRSMLHEHVTDPMRNLEKNRDNPAWWGVDNQATFDKMAKMLGRDK